MKSRLLLVSTSVLLVVIMSFGQPQNQPASTVSVVGAVRMPGVYRIVREITVSQVIAHAQGFAQDADKKNVQITREGVADPITINLSDVLTGKTPDVPLRAGDVVRVPQIVRR